MKKTPWLLLYSVLLVSSAHAQTTLYSNPATGDVGIGTAAPVNPLDVYGQVAIGTGYAGIASAPTNGLIVQGSVGIGSSIPAHPLDVLIQGTQGIINFTSYNNGATNVGVAQASARGSLASPVAVQAGDRLFAIFGAGYDSSKFYVGSAIFGIVDTGTVSSGSLPTLLSFYTTPDGSESRVERMRIDSSGNVGIGTVSPRGGSKLDVNGTLYVGSFASGSSTTVCQNGNVLSSCTSARRFKENIQPMQLGLKEVLEMKPVTFDLRDHKDNWEKHDFGFIAEDMEKINPLFATYDGKGQINGVRYTQLTAVNARAIQELNDVITEQKEALAKQQAEIDDLKLVVKQLQKNK